MAAELKERLGATSEIIQSSGGVFEVETDGVLIFSKKSLGRFPDEHEVLAIVHGLQDGQSLSAAQENAASEHHRQSPGFIGWLKGLLSG